MGNTRTENNNMRKQTWKAAVSAAAIATSTTASARSLLYYYDFDTVENGVLVYTGVNKGTGTAEFTFKNHESSPLGYTTGALGSDHAFYSSSRSSIWLGSGSASLGCGTERGFTISFWCKLSASHDQWSDFIGFRVGGISYRLEYNTGNSSSFTIYANRSPLKHPETGETLYYSDAAANVWHHFAIVATPNGTNTIGTCALFVNGNKVGNVVLEKSGDLQQINVGTWQRNGDGGSRNYYSANNTGVDELAVFDYPATAEQVKWLAKFKPAQPAAGPGREMPYCWHFDTTNKNFGATAKINSGTGTKVASLWGDENASGAKTSDYITAPTTNAALGTAYAMNAGNRATWRIHDSAGLGPTVGSGFTISFWMCGNAKPYQWSDCFTFGIGGRYIRCEFNDDNPAGIYFYGGSPSVGPCARNTDTWQHYCAVWNDAEQKIDFYMDGVLKGSATYGITPDPAHVVTTMMAGRQSHDKDGTWRLVPSTFDMLNPDVFVDEVAMFNHSLSPEQIQWLANNVPCLPPIDATNLVRTVSADCAWAGGRASWTVRDTTRTTIYPSCEDVDVEAEAALANGVTITNDTYVTPKRLVLSAAAASPLPVTATLAADDGSRFAPQSLEVGDGVVLTVSVGDVLAERASLGDVVFGTDAKIVFDVTDCTERVTRIPVGNITLPDGEDDVTAHFGMTGRSATLNGGAFIVSYSTGELQLRYQKGFMLIVK